MKKFWVTLLSIVTVLSVFSGCSLFCSHEWENASCTAPKRCKLCGKTEGGILDHSWGMATCTAPETCQVCGKTEGTSLAHDWTEATCTAPKTCQVCGKTEGKALPHNWTEATCTLPATCRECGQTTGPEPRHSWTNDSADLIKTCSVCLKQVEFFYSPQNAELLAWTEYEIIQNVPTNPVSYSARDKERIDWELTEDTKKLQIQTLDGVKLFYINNKMYYLDINYCEMDQYIAKKLAIAASRYVSVRSYSWSDQLDVTLKDGDDYLYSNIIGSAFAAFDISGSQYVIVRKYSEADGGGDAYAFRYNWK